MAHPGGQLQPGVEIERGPRRVDRRLDAPFGVERTERGGVGRDLDAGREVAAARLDDGIRTGGEEVAPESEHLRRRIRNALRVEGLLVEKRARDAPRLLAESHAVGEPDVVEAEGAGEGAVLRAEERADGKPLRDALRKGGVAAGVGVERRGADEEASRKNRVAEHHLAVAAVFEIRNRELRAVVERRADADFAPQHFARGVADRGDGVAQPRIRQRRGDIVREYLRRELVRVAALARRGIFGLRTVVRAAAPAGPLERVGEVARPVQQFAAVGHPEHDGNLIRAIGQRAPLAEHRARGGACGCDGARPFRWRLGAAGGRTPHERLGADFKRDVAKRVHCFSSVTTTVSMPRARPSFFSSAAWWPMPSAK